MAFADGPARPRPRLRRAARAAARRRGRRRRGRAGDGARAAPRVRADHAADPARGRRRAHVRLRPRLGALGRAARGRRRARCARRSRVRAGEQARLLAALGVAPRTARAPEPTPAERVLARIDDTAEAWRSWEAEHDVYRRRAPRSRPAQRARAEGPHVPADRARSSPRRRPRCPRRSAASATGTTASPGSATRA